MSPSPAPAPQKRAPRLVDPNKAISVNVDPDMRARAETVWRKHNEMAPVPATKSAIYKASMDSGLRIFEEKLGIVRAAP